MPHRAAVARDLKSVVQYAIGLHEDFQSLTRPCRPTAIVRSREAVFPAPARAPFGLLELGVRLPVGA